VLPGVLAISPGESSSIPQPCVVAVDAGSDGCGALARYSPEFTNSLARSNLPKRKGPDFLHELISDLKGCGKMFAHLGKKYYEIYGNFFIDFPYLYRYFDFHSSRKPARSFWVSLDVRQACLWIQSLPEVRHFTFLADCLFAGPSATLPQRGAHACAAKQNRTESRGLIGVTGK
jgi:hypothetical protein